MKVLLKQLREDINSEYKLSSTQLYVPNDIAANVLRFTLSIAEGDLYTEDGMGRELEVHITIFYGLTNPSPTVVKTAMEDYGKKEITGKLGSVSLFESNDKPYDVIKFDVESEDLHDLHKIFKQLDNKETFPDYKPHCTVAYVRKGLGKKYLGKEDILDKVDFKVDKFYFCSANGDKFRITI